MTALSGGPGREIAVVKTFLGIAISALFTRSARRRKTGPMPAVRARWPGRSAQSWPTTA